MRILQVSCIVGPHQLPLARCIAERIGASNFRFAATSTPSLRRLNLGWDFDEKESWILRVSERADDKVQFERWWHEADVVLCGDRLFQWMKERTNNAKLTFHMSERWWKPPFGMMRLLHPRFAIMSLTFRQLTESPFFHFLSIGEYSAGDISRITNVNMNIWRWGYFTATSKALPEYHGDDHGFQVLWAGRMLGWKRVDTLIKAFAILLLNQPASTLTLVGEGKERNRLEKLARKVLKIGSYRFLTPMPTSEIIKLMGQYDVYVLPSNGTEGWGAVVNEAMGEGCLVIASEAVGAATSLIRHGVNGLLFAPGDWRKLGDLLCQVSNDGALRNRLAHQGQCTVAETWSPEVAANRFISICDALLSERSIPVFDDGPMVMIPRGKTA